MFLYSEDSVSPIRAREADRDYRDTDAGTDLSAFIVQAQTHEAALDGARRWIALWRDEDEDCVPDDLMLEEREYRSGKTYMTLRVL
jgi:hypothetical protein